MNIYVFRFIPEGKPDIGIEVIISKPQNVGIPSWEELQALLKEEILASSLDIDATTCMFAYTVPTWIEPHSVERNYITSHVVLERAIRRAGRVYGNEVLMDITMVPGIRLAEDAEMISTMKGDVTKNEDEMIEMSVKMKDDEGESEVEDENKESETDKNDYRRESETVDCEHDNSSDEDMSESGSGSPTPHPTGTQCPSQYYTSHNKEDFALFREETEELYYELQRPIGNMAQLFAPVVMEALCSVDDGIEPELVFRWIQSRMQGMYRSIERWHREQTSPRAEAESVHMRITPPTPELEATKSESPIPTRILTTIPTISWTLLKSRRHSTPETWAAESGVEIVDFDASHLDALLVEWDRLLNYCPVASRFAHNPETHIEGVEEGGCPCVDGMIALMAYLDDKILTGDILMHKLVAFALIPAFERSLTQAKREVPKSAPYIADRILMVAYKNMRKRGYDQYAVYVGLGGTREKKQAFLVFRKLARLAFTLHHHLRRYGVKMLFDNGVSVSTMPWPAGRCGLERIAEPPPQSKVLERMMRRLIGEPKERRQDLLAKGTGYGLWTDDALGSASGTMRTPDSETVTDLDEPRSSANEIVGEGRIVRKRGMSEMKSEVPCAVKRRGVIDGDIK